MLSDPTFSDLSDEEIQQRLGAEGLRGPQFFRGRELARYSPGLRDLVMKVVSPQDTAVLHDTALVYILLEAHGKSPEDKLERRRRLLAATDDRESFRLKVNVEWLDELTDAEIGECKRLVDDILAPVKLAQVAVVAPPGKKKARAAAKRSRTRRSSLSWPLMAACGWTEDFLRWECALVDVLRWRHAQLWSDGHRCRRTGQVAARAQAKRRQRFDTAAALYARH